MPTRPMKNDEKESLEILLAYSDIEAEWNNWLDMGEPEHHIYTHIRRLINFIQAVKPDTLLKEPKPRSKPQVAVSKWDSEPIFKKDVT